MAAGHTVWSRSATGRRRATAVDSFPCENAARINGDGDVVVRLEMNLTIADSLYTVNDGHCVPYRRPRIPGPDWR